MQNERLGKTIIDALTLCYLAEGKVLDHLREVKHQYSIDTFTLHRTSGKHHKEHFDIYLHKKKVATITRAQAEEIAKTKMPDLNAANLESATEMIKGTARSMGIVVED